MAGIIGHTGGGVTLNKDCVELNKVDFSADERNHRFSVNTNSMFQ